MALTNWQVFFIAFPLWVFAVTLIVFLFLVLQAVRKYGSEIKNSLDDLQVDLKRITNSAAVEVPEILRNASETSEEVKEITSNLKQVTAVLPLMMRPNWATVALKTLPSILSFLSIGKGKKVRKEKGGESNV